MIELKSFIQKAGFWVLLLILLGFFIGGYTMHKYQSINIKTSIELEGFVYNNKVYDIKERIK